MHGLTLISELLVFWDWAVAEIHSHRFKEFYKGLPTFVVAALERGDPALLSPAGWTILKQTVFGVRISLLAGLRRLGTSWYTGRLAPGDLKDLMLLDLPLFRDLSASLHLDDLVSALDRGDSSPNDSTTQPSFVDNYRAQRPTFELSRMRGKPVLIGWRKEGPYGILEGCTRLAILRSMQTGGTSISDLPAVFGVCPRIGEWRLGDNVTGRALYWG
jgi:hypothetical protein